MAVKIVLTGNYPVCHRLVLAIRLK